MISLMVLTISPVMALTSSVYVYESCSTFSVSTIKMGASRRSSEEDSSTVEEAVSGAADSGGSSTIGASAKAGSAPESDSPSFRADFRDPLENEEQHGQILRLDQNLCHDSLQPTIPGAKTT